MPLGRLPFTSPLDDEDTGLKTQLEGTLSKAGRLVSNLENRVELLVRACQEANIPIPGVRAWQFKHPVTGQGRKIISYLEKMINLKPDLARQIQVAIFRFQEAMDVIKMARAKLRSAQATPATLEEVKLKFFFLAYYHEEFKTDPLLTQMFPPPDEPAIPQGTGAIRGTGNLAMPDSVGRYKAKREHVANKAHLLVRHLQPGFDRIKHLLESHPREEKPGSNTLIDRLNPLQHMERAMVKNLRDDPKAIKHIRSAFQLFGQMKEQIVEVRKGAKYEPLAEVMEYMGNLLGVWHQHPILKDFFPGLRKELFFVDKSTP